MYRNRIAKTIVASVAALALTGASAGSLGLVHAAPAGIVAHQAASTTFVDANRSYSLSYPSTWTRNARKGFDLFLWSSNKNVVIAATGVATADAGAGRLSRDLQQFTAALGKPLGQPTYTTYHLHGSPLRVGMCGFVGASGKAGVVVMEEAYTKGRLTLVAGVVLDAAAPSAKADVTAALTVLTSLQLQPNVLDAPSG